MTTTIGYTYDADTHCLDCTVNRFGDAIDFQSDQGAIDSEGNPVHPIFTTDETSPAGQWCGSCGDCFDTPWRDAADDDLIGYGVERETFEALQGIAARQGKLIY